MSSKIKYKKKKSPLTQRTVLQMNYFGVCLEYSVANRDILLRGEKGQIKRMQVN